VGQLGEIHKRRTRSTQVYMVGLREKQQQLGVKYIGKITGRKNTRWRWLLKGMGVKREKQELFLNENSEGGKGESRRGPPCREEGVVTINPRKGKTLLEGEREWGRYSG